MLDFNFVRARERVVPSLSSENKTFDPRGRNPHVMLITDLVYLIGERSEPPSGLNGAGFLYMSCRILLPPCINCVLHIGPAAAGSPALRANVIEAQRSIL